MRRNHTTNPGTESRPGRKPMLTLAAWTAVFTAGRLASGTLFFVPIVFQNPSEGFYYGGIFFVSSMLSFFYIELTSYKLLKNISIFVNWLAVAVSELGTLRQRFSWDRPDFGALNNATEFHHLIQELQRPRTRDLLRPDSATAAAVDDDEALNADSGDPLLSSTPAPLRSWPIWANELRAPLTAVSNYVAAAHQVLNDQRNCSEAERLLAAAVEQVARCEKIIKRRR